MLEGTLSAGFVTRETAIQGNIPVGTVDIMLRGLLKLKLSDRERLQWALSLDILIAYPFTSFQKSACRILLAPAGGIIELQIHFDGLPVQELDATNAAKFVSHCKTKIISIFDRVFGGNSDVHETQCCIVDERSSEKFTLKC